MSSDDKLVLVERLRLEAKSGTGAALDWTNEERADYWSRIALRLRPLCREAASVLASVLRERDEAREKVEPVGYLWKTIDDRWAFTERNAPSGSGRPVVFASALEASEAKIAALTAENATLREALRPFADVPPALVGAIVAAMARRTKSPFASHNEARRDFEAVSVLAYAFGRARAALRQEGKA